ncbi:MAG: hypothetical protein ACREVC_10685 [Burkholderiales bacterium]
MRFLIFAFCTLLGAAIPAAAQVSIGISSPGLRIGINVPVYPRFARVPGYPVYYAPGLNANYFFYDGRYWVFQDDRWYASTWYNGPWSTVDPYSVPPYVLRIPVRYYRHPPAYFHGWRRDAAPRWGDHWGREWSERRSGWDRWNHKAAPRPAPLPRYQRSYSGEHYPRAQEQQHELATRNYRYQPREAEAREHNVERGHGDERGHGQGDDHRRDR